MLRLASPTSLDLLTGLVNEVIDSGRVPEALLEGRMSLIDKKSPSLFVHEKQPLTVSNILLSVITKIVHKRMIKFVKGRDSTDHASSAFVRTVLLQIAFLFCWQPYVRQREMVIEFLLPSVT